MKKSLRARMTKTATVALRRFMSTAKELARDPEEISYLLREGCKVFSEHTHLLAAAKDEFQTLRRMLSAWRKGDYQEVPRNTIVLAVAAIVYVISPIDAIPDFLPVIGFTDDVSIILFVARSLKEDLRRYRDWEEGK
jgi:uncharacterized membrane protein YkvA (DUF1232 family)